MPRSGPHTVRRYSDEFKLSAVRLSQEPGLQVKAVAAALAIHPFMLSKWRKDVRDGRLRGKVKPALPLGRTRELAQLQSLERKYAQLEQEHELLKSHPVLFRAKGDRFAFIGAHHAAYSVSALCRHLGVTRAGVYAWHRRDESGHAKQDRTLGETIAHLFAIHHARYGSPRIHQLLNRISVRTAIRWRRFSISVTPLSRPSGKPALNDRSRSRPCDQRAPT